MANIAYIYSMEDSARGGLTVYIYVCIICVYEIILGSRQNNEDGGIQVAWGLNLFGLCSAGKRCWHAAWGGRKLVNSREQTLNLYI